MSCSNNLKQLGLAAHNCNDTYGKLPPANGYFPNGPDPNIWFPAGKPGQIYGTELVHFLPFIEQQNIIYDPSNPNINQGGAYYVNTAQTDGNLRIKTYVCPSDPSVGYASLIGWGQGDCSYAGNWYLFGIPGFNGSFAFGAFEGGGRIPTSFPDGTSNTILFAEKYAGCGKADPNGPYGNLWAWGWDYLASPIFACSFAWGSQATGPGSKWQQNPNPWQTACDARYASSNHVGGMNVLLGDGSVRFLTSGMSGNTWWNAVVPDDGVPLGSDW
jgi:prepilin-type processing-associated H-X9-DG protein